MRNKWKTAFWIQFGALVIITLVFLYVTLNQSMTITYMKEGYEDTEFDLMQVSSSIKGKLSRQDFQDIINRFPDYKGEDLELNRVKISFGSDGKVDSVTTKW